MPHRITSPENNCFPISLANWQLGLVRSVNTGLIGITNSAFSHEFGCSIHLHSWQIMLPNWLMCHALHRVLNHVAHSHRHVRRSQSHIWPWIFFSLACIIAKNIQNVPSASPGLQRSPALHLFLSWNGGECNQRCEKQKNKIICGCAKRSSKTVYSLTEFC